jgi:hypothetical protein
VGRKHLARFFFDRFFLREILSENFDDLCLERGVVRFAGDQILLAINRPVRSAPV